MADISGAGELLGASAAGAATAIGSLYKLFIPRSESEKSIKALETTLEDQKKHYEKRLDMVEFSLSKTITRETLDDIMGPIKEDLKDIKLMMRAKNGQ